MTKKKGKSPNTKKKKAKQVKNINVEQKQDSGQKAAAHGGFRVKTFRGREVEIPEEAFNQMQSSSAPIQLINYPQEFTDLIINVWALRSKIAKLDGQLPPEVFRQLQRPVESAMQRLAQAGIDVIDNTHKKFHIGDSVKVIAYEETDGITDEVVKETIKPTIRAHNETLHYGEIIVGTPKKKAAKKQKTLNEEE